VRRQQGSGGHFEYEDESRGMMIDYSDHQPYREGSATPVLDDCEEDVDEDDLGFEGRAAVAAGKFKLTEVAVDEEALDDYSPRNSDVYEDDYDIHYESGWSKVLRFTGDFSSMSPIKPDIILQQPLFVMLSVGLSSSNLIIFVFWPGWRTVIS
jgi:hypothetical protein